jgi:hypothetical protein
MFLSNTIRYTQAQRRRRMAIKYRIATLEKLIGGHCRARGAYQLIRLFKNVGICRLFSCKKAEHHKRRAKYQA